MVKAKKVFDHEEIFISTFTFKLSLSLSLAPLELELPTPMTAPAPPLLHQPMLYRQHITYQSTINAIPTAHSTGASVRPQIVSLTRHRLPMQVTSLHLASSHGR
jgi:hypothetical protein